MIIQRQIGIGASVAIAATLLGGCVSVGKVDVGVITMNVSVYRYNNSLTLLNILRAKDRAPLQFTTLTSLTGHNTLTGVLGLPTITLGPHVASNPRSFAFGPNSTTKTDSADFNVAVNDDPISTSALMSPVDPGTLAFFINQGYDEELVLFLFVRLVKIETGLPITDKNDKLLKPATFVTYVNNLDADDNYNANSSIKRLPKRAGDPGYIATEIENNLQALNEFGPFGQEIDYLVGRGLKIEVDKFGVPSARGVPAFRLCFDDDYNVNHPPDSAATPLLTLNACTGPDGWIPPPKSSDAGHPDDKGPYALRTDAINALAKAFSSSSSASSKSGASSNPQSYWETGDVTKGSAINLQLRSVFEVYQYLGAIVRKDIALSKARSGPPFINLVAQKDGGRSSGCFASADAHGTHWCVPDEPKSVYTKQVFAMMRQIMSLYTSPSSQTNTPTVRAISE